MSERQALFISHASPEDNAFTIWLRARLAAAGYEVWADVLRLTGGDNSQRKLEDALRNRARKVLLVANRKSADKQGVRNEIQIASDVAKKISDERFIIPLKLGPFDAPFLSPAVCALRAKRLSPMPNISTSVMAGLPDCMNSVGAAGRIQDPAVKRALNRNMELAAGDPREKARPASRAAGLKLAAGKKTARGNPLLPQRGVAKQRRVAIGAQRSIWRRFFDVRRTSHRRCKQGFTERCPQRGLAGAGYPEYRNAEDVHPAREWRNGTVPAVAGIALLRDGKTASLRGGSVAICRIRAWRSTGVA
jgi:hypothetical protein